MTLKELIAWLEQQDPDMVVVDGFGRPHCDRARYKDLAFDPVKKTTFGEMLKYAKSANGNVFFGWKGGEYQMHEDTDCRIGYSGMSSEEITTEHFELWLLTAQHSEPTDVLPSRKNHA